VEDSGKRKRRSAYRPTVEALEALRMLSSAAHSLPHLTVERDLLHDVTPVADPPDRLHSDAAWDAALTQTTLAELLGPSATTSARAALDAHDISAGLGQLNRYLSRAWFRAGVAPQLHDDSTQAVYVALLQNLGRARFDQLMRDIGRTGIRDVLSRETADGPDFFRAIDTVKKRAQRERIYQSIEAIDVAAKSPAEQAADTWRGALQEAIDQSLTPREAALIHDTLMGKTPAEIASAWGVAPKTVSNEKTRVIQKLRDALMADLSN
jgi:RNA polymerase sigma factor (sigma-70 family)